MKSTLVIGAALLLGVAGLARKAGAEPAPTTRPATQPAIPQPTGLGSQSTSISIINGDKVVDVHQPGRTIHIEENGTGVLVRVTGQIDGKEVTREYRAITPEQLKKAYPEAYALFLQYGKGVHVAGLAHAGALPPGAGHDQALKLLEKHLLEQLKENTLPEAQQEEIKKLLKQLQDGAGAAIPPGAAPADARKQLEKDLLEHLKDGNLPDAQQEEIKKLLKELQDGAGAAVPPGPAPKDARKLEKDLLEQLKDSNLPDAQQEEVKKLLKELQD